MRPPSPGRIAWIVRVTEEWAARAGALRGETSPAVAVRAAVLDRIVANLRSEIPATEPPPAARPATVTTPRSMEIDRLEAILARCTGSYLHPDWGVMVNDAPFLDDVEHRLRCRVAELRGEAAPPYLRRRTVPAPETPAPPAAAPAPPPEALPFRAGPQLTLFEYTA